MSRSKIAIQLTLMITVTLIIATLFNSASAQDEFPEVGVCPRSQGYWANTPEAWTVSELTLGAQVYTQAELLAILPGGGGDASTMLAVQLTAAKLNILNGTDASPINAIIAQADSLLAAYPNKLPFNVAASSPEGQLMIAAASILDAFNNGQYIEACFEETLTPTTTATTTPTSTTTTTLATPTITATSTPTATPTATPTIDSTAIFGTATAVNLNCQNPPPTWAPAWGWRRRCENAPFNPPMGNGKGNYNGNGN